MKIMNFKQAVNDLEEQNNHEGWKEGLGRGKLDLVTKCAYLDHP